MSSLDVLGHQYETTAGKPLRLGTSWSSGGGGVRIHEVLLAEFTSTKATVETFLSHSPSLFPNLVIQPPCYLVILLRISPNPPQLMFLSIHLVTDAIFKQSTDLPIHGNFHHRAISPCTVHSSSIHPSITYLPIHSPTSTSSQPAIAHPPRHPVACSSVHISVHLCRSVYPSMCVSIRGL